MPRRVLTACLPLLLVAGCYDDYRTRLVTGPATSAAPARAERYVSKAPATEETAKRVLAVGQKLLVSNPQLGLRPVFVTVGAPQPEIFHRGGALDGYQVFVSQGLVERCKDDAELAALLCLELGKIVAEREAIAGPARRGLDKPPPIREAIGNDIGGTFGGADGTQAMEQAKYERDRRAAAPPTPDALARKYLARAGYQESALDDAAPLLRQAEENFAVEKQLGNKAAP
jgi:predicted Zn-dependent protease